MINLRTDADDSSDEDLVETRVNQFSPYDDKFEVFWKTCQQETQAPEEDKQALRCSFLLHQMGVELLYNQTSNILYYQLKKKIPFWFDYFSYRFGIR